jgi:small subunit ribosomal protein YMR-31
VVRTLEPWEGEVSERERDMYHNHEALESDTGCPKHVHKASITNTYKQRPLSLFHQSNSHPACILLSALHIGRLFLSLGNVNGHLVRVPSFSQFCAPAQHGPGPQPQRPHPAAPTQLKETFSNFLKKYNSPSPSSGRNAQQNSQGLAFKDFWDAPAALWRPKVRQLEDAEIDAVLVS